MPERAGHTETLRPGTPLRVGRVILLPIERVVVRWQAGALGACLGAAKEPYALVVRDDGGLRAVDAGATEVSLGRLRERVPGLDAVLASL
jgi:hypothetical protein